MILFFRVSKTIVIMYFGVATTEQNTSIMIKIFIQTTMTPQYIISMISTTAIKCHYKPPSH